MLHGFLKQSTASQARTVGPFIDDTDFKTPETGLTIANTDVKLSKNGGVGVDKNSGGGTHRNNGMYSLTFDAADTDTVGELEGSILVTGAVLVVFKFAIVEEAIYNALFAPLAAGFDANQRVDVGSWLGTAVTLTSGAPQVSANITAINSDTAAAAALEAGMDIVILGTVDDTAFTPTTTIFETDIVIADPDILIGRLITFRAGTGVQFVQKAITDYALVAGRGRITVSALPTAPLNGATLVIM